MLGALKRWLLEEGLTEGKHTVEIYLTLGEEVQLVDTPKVAIKLTPFVEEESEGEMNTEDDISDYISALK